MDEPDESAIRDVLVVERAAALARIRAMQGDLDAIVAATAGSNTDDEHDPEGSTIAYERAQVTALLAGARANLADLDHALARLSGGTYLLCERCHSQIAPERLAALPAGRTCFACANSAPVTGISEFGHVEPWGVSQRAG
jgi:RNA polymerase-binding transcription factor DksA